MEGFPLWIKFSFAFIIYVAIYAAIEHWPDSGKKQDDRIEIQIQID